MKHEIVIKSKIAEIPKLTDSFSSYGKKNHLDDDSIFDFCVALDEIVNNIVNYGYNGESVHEIKINFSLKKDLICVCVSDDGKPFNPCELTPPDISKPIEEKPVGGLGFFLVKQLMDSVEYKRQENKNILVLNKKINFSTKNPIVPKMEGRRPRRPK